MGSVYNEYCIVTSFKIAKLINMEKDKYFVELSPRFQTLQYNIEGVFYTQDLDIQETVVSVNYGLLKVSYKT